MVSRFRRSTADKDEGFTLIELLVVIIIIGILTAIAIPVYLNQRQKSVDASLKSDLHSAAVIIETWAIDHPGDAIPGPYEYAPPIGAAGGVLNDLKVSPGNVVILNPSTPAGAWCLYAFNPGASKAYDHSHYMTWKSVLGGLAPDIVLGAGGDCQI